MVVWALCCWWWAALPFYCLWLGAFVFVVSVFHQRPSRHVHDLYVQDPANFPAFIQYFPFPFQLRPSTKHPMTNVVSQVNLYDEDLLTKVHDWGTPIYTFVSAQPNIPAQPNSQPLHLATYLSCPTKKYSFVSLNLLEQHIRPPRNTHTPLILLVYSFVTWTSITTNYTVQLADTRQLLVYLCSVPLQVASYTCFYLPVLVI